MRVFAAALALLVLVGCTPPTPYRVTDPIDGQVLGLCYDGTFQAWCQVAQPAGTVVVAGTSAAAAAMSLAGVSMNAAAVLSVRQ